MPVPFDLTSTRARPRCIAGSTLSGWMGWIGGKGREGKGSDWWRSATGGRRGGSHPRRSATSSVGNLLCVCVCVCVCTSYVCAVVPS